jgi:hypothetical protein
VNSTSVGLQAFREDVDDRLVNIFGRNGELRVVNGPGVSARGLSLLVGRHLGDAVKGSVAYTYGRASHRGNLPAFPGPEELLSDGSFHEVVAQLETFVDVTDTRLAALYRVHATKPDLDLGQPATPVSRFDVQLTQGLPFLDSLTRAEWEFLLAFRNLLYEASDQAAILDEVAVEPAEGSWEGSRSGSDEGGRCPALGIRGVGWREASSFALFFGLQTTSGFGEAYNGWIRARPI